MKISYGTDNNIFNNINPKTKIEDHNKNIIYKIKRSNCNKDYIGQNIKQLMDHFIHHRNACLNPNTYTQPKLHM